MKKVSIHTLQNIRDFAENHNKHSVFLENESGFIPVLIIRTEGKPCNETSAEYKVEISEEEFFILEQFLNNKGYSESDKYTFIVEKERLFKIIDFIEENMYKHIGNDESKVDTSFIVKFAGFFIVLLALVSIAYGSNIFVAVGAFFLIIGIEYNKRVNNGEIK